MEEILKFLSSFRSSAAAPSAPVSDIPNPAHILRTRRMSGTGSINGDTGSLYSGTGGLSPSKPSLEKLSPRFVPRRESSASSFKDLVNGVVASVSGDGAPCPPPTRSHWVPDSKSVFCNITGCGRAFSLIERIHHCRR